MGSSGVDVARDGGGAAAGGVVVAPFVAKTYRMVDDPVTDAVIYWGRDNNSFVVADPFALSRDLLPVYFKHANFSSFVRQLNTYGFRKVDPDRWEFAHQSFLRGQTHLLSRISRRSSGRRRSDDENESEIDSRVAAEVARLRREQRGAEEEVRRMWERVAEMERRPRQLLAFVLRVLGDPEMLQRLTSRVSPAAAAAASAPDDGRGPVKRARICADEFNLAASVGAAGIMNGGGAVEMGVKEEIDPWPVNEGNGSFLGLDSEAGSSFLQAADPFGNNVGNYGILGSY